LLVNFHSFSYPPFTNLTLINKGHLAGTFLTCYCTKQTLYLLYQQRQHYLFHRNTSLGLLVSRIRTVHILIIFFKILLNIILALPPTAAEIALKNHVLKFGKNFVICAMRATFPALSLFFVPPDTPWIMKTPFCS